MCLLPLCNVCILKHFMRKCSRAYSQVRIWWPIPSQEWPYLHGRWSVLNRMNNLQDCHILRYGCLHLQFTENLPTKKKVFQKWPDFQVRKFRLLWSCERPMHYLVISQWPLWLWPTIIVQYLRVRILVFVKFYSIYNQDICCFWIEYLVFFVKTFIAFFV